MVIGQNPGTNHPRMLSTLREAKLAGASVISINPLVEAGMGRFKHPQKPLDILGRGTKIADEHLIVKVNGDQALFRGLSKYLIRHGSIDDEFIRKFTNGFDEYSKIVGGTSWHEIESASGVDRGTISRIASQIAKSRSIICCWAMGLTQHKNSVSTIQEIANFSLLRGNIGRPGAGLCPVRGHSNVQGDRTVGINHNPPQYLLDGLLREFDVQAPKLSGSDAVESVKNMTSGTAKVFLSMGGNFLSAMSDSNRTAEALKSCELTVQVSTKPNRSHLITGETALTQNDIKPRGHAIECRINAEDPSKNFQPSPGLINMCHLPSGFRTRVDGAIYQGYKVTPYYDSMVCKLICHGRNRSEAVSYTHLTLPTKA